MPIEMLAHSGNPAISSSDGPEALRPRFATGLPMYVLNPATQDARAARPYRYKVKTVAFAYCSTIALVTTMNLIAGSPAIASSRWTGGFAPSPCDEFALEPMAAICRTAVAFTSGQDRNRSG